MQRLLWALLTLFFWTAPQALAQDPVADRAVAAAKEYVKAKGLKDPKLTILLSSLYNNSFPDFAKKWEELTGVKFEIVPLGYTDIPAKIMQEARVEDRRLRHLQRLPLHDAGCRRRQGDHPARRSTPRNTSRTSQASPTA